jgi:hypothetical protein
LKFEKIYPPQLLKIGSPSVFSVEIVARTLYVRLQVQVEIIAEFFGSLRETMRFFVVLAQSCKFVKFIVPLKTLYLKK